MKIWSFVSLSLLMSFTGIFFVTIVSANQDTGTILGKVSLNTTAPALPKIVTDKSIDFCGTSLTDPILLVQDMGVKGAVVSIAWEGGVQTNGKPHHLSLKSQNCLFQPRIQAAQVGAYLHLNSGDETPHNPHGWWNNTKTVFNITLLAPNLKFKRKLRQPGTYRIECDTHSWMKSYILVFNHPFFALTDEKGNFVLKNIPMGRHTIRVWHEILGEHTAEVIVPARNEIQHDFVLPFADHREETLKPKTLAPWPPGQGDLKGSTQ